jgi:hypothetical protein
MQIETKFRYESNKNLDDDDNEDHSKVEVDPPHFLRGVKTVTQLGMDPYYTNKITNTH